MKRLVLTGAALLALAACATSTPVQTADGSYLLSTRVALGSEAGALNAAVERANKHCGSLGKTVRLISQKTSECFMHGGCGEATITYACAAP